jgi:hypothetical protein
MIDQKRPEWIESAAQAVTELYQREHNIELAKDQIQSAGEPLTTSLQDGAGHVRGFIQSDVYQTREEIARIIQRYFQETG